MKRISDTKHEKSVKLNESRTVSGQVTGWFVALLLTLLGCLGAWRLSVVLDTPLMLCGAYAIPAALSLRGLTNAFGSFCAVSFVGVFLLQSAAPGARLSFILVGIAVAGSALYLSVSAGRRLAESRVALGIVRLRASANQDALQQAGVCMLTVGRNLTWSNVNKAAWEAFGANENMFRGLDSRVELDDEAAYALMHSGSSESWRRFFESVVASDIGGASALTASPQSYLVSLYDSAGQKRNYRFAVSSGLRGELTFVGFPIASSVADAGAATKSPGDWFRNVLRNIADPSVIVQSDGEILAANGAFRVLCGNQDAKYLFDCDNIRGASEMKFAANVWITTQNGACALPNVRLAGVGPSLAARIEPPGTIYTESVLLVFKDEDRPIPDGFTEVSGPIGL